MTARDHIPGYAPALDTEDLRAMSRLPFPLGVPLRVKELASKRMRDFVEAVMPPELLKPFDPLTVENMTRSDVPGVLIAAGPEQVTKSLQRVADSGVDPNGMAEALYERARNEGDRDVADAVLCFMRKRAQAITAAKREKDAYAQSNLDRVPTPPTTLHLQAGAIMGAMGVSLTQQQAMQAVGVSAGNAQFVADQQARQLEAVKAEAMAQGSAAKAPWMPG